MKRGKPFFKSAIQALSHDFAETLWPTRCIGCEEPGFLLCETCKNNLERINYAFACPRCGAPWGHIVCTECPNPGSVDRNENPIELPYCFESACAACNFDGIAEKLIRSYKDHDERRCDEIIAIEIARAVCNSLKCQNNTAHKQTKNRRNIVAPKNVAQEKYDYIVAIPTTSQALKKRGFDHMACIAKKLSNILAIPQLDIFESRKSADQRLLNAEERMENKKGSFAIKNKYICSKEAYEIRAKEFRSKILQTDVKKSVQTSQYIQSNPSITNSPKKHTEGDFLTQRHMARINYFLKKKSILLIDDVFTTGATLNAASQVLLENGAESVHVAVFTRVW